jgi:hypothetical protein
LLLFWQCPQGYRLTLTTSYHCHWLSRLLQLGGLSWATSRVVSAEFPGIIRAARFVAAQ